MANVDAAQITELLRLSSQGDSSAEAMVMEILEADLRRLAINCMRSERGDHTLQPTALVNEAYLRLVGQRGKQWKNRNHFLALATQVMRRILVDYARAYRSAKRGGGRPGASSTNEIGTKVDKSLDELLDLDNALDRLAKLDPRQVRIIEMRFFGGLTEAEIAATIGISERTVKREWKAGRAWLYGELHYEARKRE
jgi:RNA polymerase sigma-70 factor (ECF subfamily)